MSLYSMTGASASRAGKFEVRNRKDDTPGLNKEQAFRAKLLAFRKELAEKERTGEAEKENEKKMPKKDVSEISFSGNPRLFSAWNSQMPIEDALKELDGNLSQVGEFSLDSKVSPEEALEHFASQYTIYKQHIQKKGTPEQLKALDAILDKHMEKYAKEFSEVVGGFYESHGMPNERKWMYESVKNRVTALTKCYENYISNNADAFQKILDSAELNGKSAAFEFRAAYKKDGDMETFTPGRKDLYTRRELSAAAALVSAANKITSGGVAGMESEEELGIRFGRLALDGLAALENSDAGGAHKEAFLNAVGTRIDDLIAESDKLLETKRGETDDKAAYPPLDKDAIYSIIEAMKERFMQTKSITAALQYGKEQGLAQYLLKAGSDTAPERYRYSSYWNNIINEMATQEAKTLNCLV